MSGSRQGGIVAIPIASAVIAVAVMLVTPRESLPAALAVMNETVKVAGCVGMAIAALTFEPGDYLRRGWGLSATCYALLLVRDAWMLLAPGPETAVETVGRTLLIVVANTCVVVGGWTLARAWSVAGLDLPGSTGAKRAVMAVAIGIAVVLAGPALVLDAARTFNGHWEHLWWVASDLGDLLALPIVAPVALTALAVSGGSLRWPWLLLAASLTSWILYDAILTLPAFLHVDAMPFRAGAEGFRVLAGTCALAAGLAQRRAVREIDAEGTPD